METTFITIHDLSPEGRILYSSDSVVDILGYTPDEVLNRSCWEFFHPDELPFARDMHSRGVKLDKAAVLSYCQLRNRQSQWVSCECCFTVVYDVMVVCTSIYRRGIVSESRAAQAPIVRRLFSSSPKDPRYHMLSHLSRKFNQTEQERSHEPRAALFLNRFTRTLTIMYATAGVENILGISGEEMKGRSFYYCIQENCLDDAVRCLESAKGNDSIAYMRFWFRDPRTDDPPSQEDTETGTESESDVSMTDVTSELSESDAEEYRRRSTTPREPSTHGGLARDEATHISQSAASGSGPESTASPAPAPPALSNVTSNTSHVSLSEDSVTPEQRSGAISEGTGHITGRSSDHSTPATTPDSPASNNRHRDNPGVELEAVVSCTSDGLVVCLRRARPIIPTSVHQPTVHQPIHSGIFAAPWATTPVFHPPRQGYQYWPMQAHAAAQPAVPGAFPPAANAYAPPTSGPSSQALFDSIRDTAIFAWALAGINGSLVDCAVNPKQAAGESQPPDGLPVWDGARKAYGDNYFQQHGSNSGSGSDSCYASVGNGNGNGVGNGNGRYNEHKDRRDDAPGGPFSAPSNGGNESGPK